MDRDAMRGRGGRALAVCLAFAALYLYLKVFVPPLTPVWVARSDQVIYLTNALRMLQGDVLYRDIFHFLPPGTEVFYLAAIAAFGQKAWIPSAAFFLLGLGQAWLIFRLACRLAPPWHAALAALAFLATAYQFFDAIHHWFSAFFLLAAMAVAADGRSRGHLVAAGVLLGLTSFITPSRGLLGIVALGIFLAWDLAGERPRVAALARAWTAAGLAYGLTLLAAVWPFAQAAGWDRFWYDTITFVREHYFLDSRYSDWTFARYELPELLRTLRSPDSVARLAMYLVPLVYLWVPIQARLTPVDPAGKRLLVLAAAFGALQFLGIATYPSALRIAVLSAPAFVLLAWIVGQPRALSRVGAGACAALVAALVVVRPLYQLREEAYPFDAPAGHVAFRADTEREPYEWLKEHSHPGDYVFVAGAPDFYYLLDLRNPTAVPFVVPNAYMPDSQVEEVVHALDDHTVHYVLWPEKQLAPMQGDPLPPLRRYLSECYHVVQRFADHRYQFWERNDEVATRPCHPATDQATAGAPAGGG